jgi:predicted ATP-dependent endonuclease of OLD family
MKNYAFKRAKVSPNTQLSLHPEFITEYADTTLFPEGFHKPEEGYEILAEDEFKKELDKNEARHESFLKAKQELEKATLAAQESAQLSERMKEKQAQREFDEFLRWKKQQK